MITLEEIKLDINRAIELSNTLMLMSLADKSDALATPEAIAAAFFARGTIYRFTGSPIKRSSISSAQ